MKPIEFKEQNTVYAKDQPEYLPLPAFKNDSFYGEVISCWKLTLKERIILLFTGKLWSQFLTFNKPLTPSFFTVNKKELLVNKENSKNNKKCNCNNCECKK
jgi:hypothetical protein